MTGLEYSLSEALEKKRNADVYITAKRNCNIKLKVVKTIPDTEYSENPKRYIPCETLENKLRVEVNPRLPLRRLNEIFRKFIRRCDYYISNGNGKNKQTH